MLIGPHNSHRDGITQAEMVVKVAAQIISQNVKSSRYIQYHQRNADSLFHSRLETPVNIRLGLYFYHVSRSKKLINFLTDLNLGLNYQKTVNVKRVLCKQFYRKKRK